MTKEWENTKDQFKKEDNHVLLSMSGNSQKFRLHD